jgi:hypothetical protein
MVFQVSNKCSNFIDNSIKRLQSLDIEKRNSIIKKLSYQDVAVLLPNTNHIELKELLQQRVWELYAKGSINHKVFKATLENQSVSFSETSEKKMKQLNKRICRLCDYAQKKVPLTPSQQSINEDEDPIILQMLSSVLEKMESFFNKLFEVEPQAFYKSVDKLKKSTLDFSKVSPVEAKQIISNLANETDEKVKQGMDFSSAYFAMTIGELVKKNGGEEKDYLGSGGDGCFADEVEKNVLQEIKDHPEFLTDEEQKNFIRYYNATMNCKDINKALDAYWIRADELKPEELPRKLDEFAKIPIALTNEIYDQINGLKEDESLSLNIGHFNHGMQMSVKKNEGKVEFVLFDSVGGLEFLFLLKGVLSQTQFLRVYKKGFPAHCGLSIKVSEREFNELGKQYLKNLIDHSCINYDEKRLHEPLFEALEKIENKLKELPKWQFLLRIFLKLKQKWLEIRAVLLCKDKWERTLRIFGSIAPESAELIPEMLGVQWISNCTAKRLRAIQRRELGYSLYQKTNAQQHEYSKKMLLTTCEEKNYLSPGVYDELMQLKPEFQNQQILREASLFLSRFESFPPHQKTPLTDQEQVDNNVAARYVALLMNHNIFHLNIPGRVIRTKENSLKKASIREMRSFHPSINDLRQATLVKRFRSDFSKERAIEMNIHGQRREISKQSYFSYVLKNKSHLLDHDITTNILYLAKDTEMNFQEKKLLDKIFTLQIQLMANGRDQRLAELKKQMTDQQDMLRAKIPHSEQPIDLNILEIFDAKMQLQQIEKDLAEIEEFESLLSQTPVDKKNIKEHVLFISNSYFKTLQNIERWNENFQRVITV